MVTSKLLKLVFLILISLTGELQAKVEFSSSFVKKISFSISEGLVFSARSISSDLVVKNQLQYMFGVLNELDSGIDFPSLKIEVKKQKIIDGIAEINYKASGLIAWDSRKEIPRLLNFVVPKHGDQEGLADFLNKYQKNCSKKSSSLATFWNYYRPHHEGCLLQGAVPEDAILISATLKEAHTSNNREPNYREIFDDNTLEITAIITRDNPVDTQDVSNSDFRNLCDFFAKDSISTKQLNQECHTEGFKNGQMLKSHIFLVDNFNDKPDLFLQKLAPYFVTSDVITYNGHSGMGVNIESWMKYYPVSKDKYQIIFLNSCDTFGYFRNEFFDRIKILNQSKSSSDYVDVILNATPNFFGTFANSNKQLIDSLLKGSNFIEALSRLPVEQHSLLVFER